MKDQIPRFLLDKAPFPGPETPKGSFSSAFFLDKAVSNLASFVRTGYIQWETASRNGLFQRLDARVKVLFLIFFVVIISLKQNLLSEIGLGAFLLILVVSSRIDLVTFYRRILFLGLLFGFLVPLPSSLNIFSKGALLLPLLHLPRSYDPWIYHIPETVGVTKAGLHSVLMLASRVINSLTVAFLLLYTTPFSEVVRALKVFKLPDALLMIVTLTYKYLFIFLRTVENVHLARKSRLVGAEKKSETRKWVAGRIALMFTKTQHECEEIFRAMQARGFSGTIRVYEFRKPNTPDWIAGGVLFLVGILFLFV
jgi:cobalt ECF transporter T component CbiQ